MTSLPMPVPIYKYLEPEFAKAMMSEGSIKIGTLSEYRAIEDRERGDDGEGKLTLHSPAGRQVYGGDAATLPPILRHPGIHIGQRGLETVGENAVNISSTIADLYVFCTTESLDPEYARRFGGGCVQINQPEQFFLELDTALRTAASAERILLSKPRWGRCVYEGRRYNWEREDVPAAWLLKPARYQGQREIRVSWQTDPIKPLSSVILKVPSIVPFCAIVPMAT
jgi:hypothetical protein